MTAVTAPPEAARRSVRLTERTWPWLLGALYLVLSSAWIVVTDRLVTLDIHQTAKGLAFVALSTVLLVALAQWAGRSLRAERHRIDSLVLSSPTAIVAVDRTWRVTLWSPEAERLFGWRQEEVLGRPLPIVPAEQTAEAQGLMDRTTRGEPARGLEVQRLHRDGRLLDLELATAPLRDDDGNAVGAMALYTDLRPRRQAEAQIRLQAAALEAAASGVMLTDRDGTILWVNPAFTRLTGFTAEEAVGQSPRLLRSGPAEATFLDLWQTIADGTEYRGRLLNRRKDGSLYLADVTIAAVRDPAGEPTHYVAVQEDVSEEIRLADQLRLLASYDALTGLPNRSLFLDRLRELAETTLAHRLTLVIAVAEVAQLRRVRRSLGRGAADAIVREVGKRLQGAVGSSAEVAALGGGTFALAWPAANAAEGDLALLLRRWKDLSEAPLMADGQEVHPRIVFGCAFLPRHGPTGEDVLGRAEAALAWALEEGESWRLFEDHLQTSLEQRLALESDLGGAIWSGQLRLEYQPVVDLREGRPAMAEALVRWQHPRHGLLMPSRFLPLAEETGHVRRLDFWVLRQAAVDLEGVLRHSHHRVAVNLAAATLEDDELVGYLAELRATTGLGHDEMVLEITERDAMRHPDRTAAVLGEIRALGFRVALDDFGVAYSSLNYLRHLPADYLKLDHSFVRGLGAMSRDERLVRMILSLAEDYGLEVIAEGVEEESQLEWLREHRCRYGQGFLLGRPAPLEALRAAG
jgi:PAS domain S-box-containing protein/diguanylate cyclase (GGDEF)-like protein